MIYNLLLKHILFRFDPEKAHDLTHALVKKAQLSDAGLKIINDLFQGDKYQVHVQLCGLKFPNRIGLAAGFDKNAELIPAMHALGFGFVETGSITAKPADGNPRPRMFRLPKDRALINRMGLNNQGAEVVTKSLEDKTFNIPVGINIAKTPDHSISGDAAIEDYALSYRLALPVADYITVNISCPNTGDGKTFEDTETLEQLLKRLRSVNGSDNVPLFIKFSSDTPIEQLIKLVQVGEKFGLDGYVATNTSTDRSGLKTPVRFLNRYGAGGLSGRPVAEKARRALVCIREHAGKDKVVISVGGIDSAEEAMRRMSLGADLIQLYSGLIYGGPDLVRRIKKALV